MALCKNGCGNQAKPGEEFCDFLCKMGFSNRAYRELAKERKPRITEALD